jgi:hypothetical protein
LVGIVMRLIYFGKPGGGYEPMMLSFVVFAPILVGAVAAYVAERGGRRTLRQHFLIGMAANALFILGTMLLVIEGAICAIVIAPLFITLGGVAGLAMGAICHWTQWPTRVTYGIAALPLLMGGFEQHFPTPDVVRTVERTRLVAASPEQIWTHLTGAPDIRPEEIRDAWMYRIGVPLPSAAVTRLADGKPVRHITMGKGIHFDQIAAEWEPNHRVRWLYRFSEDSFPPGALDDHVRIGGRYFDVIDTEYALRETSGGTELRVRMTYRLSTAFNWYASPIARFLVGNFEEAALRFYANRAVATHRSRAVELREPAVLPRPQSQHERTSTPLLGRRAVLLDHLDAFA